MMMEITCLPKVIRLPKDLTKLCESYLLDDEQIYLSGQNNWINFPYYDVCNIAAKYGWMDLLKWAHLHNYNWSHWT